jgi:trk system potassium uptake protein
MRSLEDATGARVAYLMRFGIGSLASPSTVLQDGDQVFMLVTDDTVESVLDVAASHPQGGQ